MTVMLLWDASALAKRYVPEIGGDVVAALFTEVAASQMQTTFLGYAETQAVLVRKRNRSVFDEAAYIIAASALQDDVIDHSDFGVLEVTSSAVLSGINLIRKYNLNASDAAILATFLRNAEREREHFVYILVCADQRFIHAANAEGLKTINPELVNAGDVPALLATL